MTIINRPDGYADGIQSPSPMTKSLWRYYLNIKILSLHVQQKRRKKDKSEKITIDNSVKKPFMILTVLDGKGLI